MSATKQRNPDVAGNLNRRISEMKERPTIRAMAAGCDSTPAWVHGVLRGTIQPTAIRLYRLCRFLGIDIQEILK